ncbi:MAG: TatD family hydrolase [Euryarchaeota archaeon]|nr:TatD family hydrolase [Euryarchaeota archaeon]
MAVTFELPIVDHHAHLRPGESALLAARNFAKAGGSHLFLATQNYLARPPRSLEEYRTQFETTESIADRVRQETGIEVLAVLAPYPIDLVHMAPETGLAAAEHLQIDTLELAAKEVREGRAVALGEVGRAHFPVDPEVKQALDRVMGTALRIAHETGCPAVLHTEDLDERGYAEVSEMTRKSGLPPERAIKHYARTVLPSAQRHGVTPSFLAKRELVREALREPGPWFFETDFLDDPARPGVALPLETVPRRVRQLLGSPALPRGDAVEKLSIPFVEAPRRLYGLELMRRSPLTIEV